MSLKRCVAVTILLAGLGAGVLALVGAARVVMLWLPHGPLVALPQIAAPRRVTTTQEGALKELRALNRLETAAFTADAIVESDNKGSTLQNLLYRDRMLLLARGRVIAGLDLAALSPEDVLVSDGSLTVRLHAPEIMSVALDGDATRVYDRTLGLFSKGDKDLETRLRREAEVAVRRSACRAGILDEAARNAAVAVRRTMALAGFASVSVRVEGPTSSCV
jgi:urease gamma subunit